MNRRGFLGMLGAVFASPLLPDPQPACIAVDWSTQRDFTRISTRVGNLWVTDEVLEDAIIKRELIETTQPGNAWRTWRPGRLLIENR